MRLEWKNQFFNDSQLYHTSMVGFRDLSNATVMRSRRMLSAQCAYYRINFLRFSQIACIVWSDARLAQKKSSRWIYFNLQNKSTTQFIIIKWSKKTQINYIDGRFSHCRDDDSFAFAFASNNIMLGVAFSFSFIFRLFKIITIVQNWK